MARVHIRKAIAFSASRPAPRFVSAIAGMWHSLVKDLFNPYRPERHYMRGPGPKWHAKHGL